MKSLILTCLFAVAVGVFSASADDSSTNKTSAPKPSSKEVAVIKTSAGEMVIEFWPDVAPKTVANFIKLSKQGFYDGTCFHRIIKGFMIQGGDPDSKNKSASPDSFGGGSPGYTIPDEFNSKKHETGVISMANTGAQNSGGCQFFICLPPADDPHMQYLNGHYTAFGKVIKGEDVLLKLGDSPCTGPNSMGEFSIPKPRVDLISIKIVPADSIK